MDAVFQGARHDLGLALRRSLRQPLTTSAILLTLAVVIGIESLLFALIDQTLLKPLPYKEPDRLVALWEKSPSRGLDKVSVAAWNLDLWRREARSFEQIAAYRIGLANLATGDAVEQALVAQVSEGYLAALRAPFVLGGGFTGDAWSGGPAGQAVLGEPVWRGLFAADPSIVGRTVELGRGSVTVVGVLAAGAELPRGAAVFVPARFAQGSDGEGVRALSVVGRLRPGVTLAAAREEMRALARRAEELNPDLNRGFEVGLAPLDEELRRPLRRTLVGLFLASTLALVAGGLNLATLEWVRVARRRRDLGLRYVLGGSRVDVWRSVLVESLALATVGGALGLLVARTGAPSARALSPLLAGLDPASLDRALAWSIVPLALFCALVLFAVPLTYLGRESPRRLLREGSHSRPGRLRLSSWQAALLVLQVAFAVPVLIGFALLLETFLDLRDPDLGFEERRLWRAELTLDPEAVRTGAADPQAQELLAVVRRQPEVLRATLTSELPTAEAGIKTTFVVSHRPLAEGESPPFAEQRMVAEGYFETLGLPLLSGRGFASGDLRAAPKVAVVNRTLAERFFAGEDPLGRELMMGSPTEFALYGGPVPWRIVGVVENVTLPGREGEEAPTLYLPLTQMPASDLQLLARVNGAALSSSELRNAVSSVSATTRIGRIDPIRRLIAEALGRPDLQLLFFAAMAVVSLLLLAVCGYALVAYVVAENGRAIGICISLGARRRDLVRLLLGQMGRLFGLGLALGALGGVVSLRLLRRQLTFELASPDAGAVIAAFAMIALVMAAAALVPARDALRLEPKKLLKAVEY